MAEEQNVASAPPKTRPDSMKQVEQSIRPKVNGNEQDRDAMFREGFLADIYQENPVRPGGLKEVKTRFPPEPNGHLHVGHAKAMAINFGFARYHGGDCCLRLDDTNPDTAAGVYYRSIKETLGWLGFEPTRITYSSDYFDRLYELAEFLINEDGAYVCHCSSKSTRDLDAEKWLTDSKKVKSNCCAVRKLEEPELHVLIATDQSPSLLQSSERCGTENISSMKHLFV